LVNGKVINFKKMEFRFTEKRNVAVFTLRQIIHSNKPILFVSHEIEDGAWQFLTGEVVSESDLMIVELEEILEHDQTLNALFDLPEGWEATRNSINEKWIRKQIG
jgi:hypothetical protein